MRATVLEFGRVDGIGGHHGFPLRPFGVADLDRDRAAERDAVPDAGEHGDLVLLELHPRAAAVAEPAAGQLARDLVGGDVDAGDHAFDHGHQRAAVGFTSCGPSQHASHLPTSPADTDFGVIMALTARKSRRNRKPSRTRLISLTAWRWAAFWSSARATIIAVSQSAP